MGAPPAKHFKGPEVSRNTSEGSDSPEESKIPTGPQPPAINRLGEPEPNFKWKKQLNIDLGTQRVQFYMSVKIVDDSGEQEVLRVGQKELPREMLDNILKQMDPGDFKTIFVDNSKLLMGSGAVKQMAGDSLIRDFLGRSDVPLSALHFPGTPDANEGGLSPYGVFCVVLGKGCQECGCPRTENVCWVYGRRICDPCAKTHRLGVSRSPIIHRSSTDQT